MRERRKERHGNGKLIIRDKTLMKMGINHDKGDRDDHKGK